MKNGTTLWMVVLCLSMAISMAQAQLLVDFGQNATGTTVQSGYQVYAGPGQYTYDPASFTEQSFSAFGATIKIKPSWVAGTPASGGGVQRQL